jgi:hypothetical protein
MKIIIHENGKQKIAEVVSDGIVINSAQDALDLMARPDIPAPKKIIIPKNNIAPDFFVLSTGLAGEVLQKFVNYRVQLAIVGNFSNLKSESLKAFIRESNRGRQIFFVENIETAKKLLFDN